MRICMLLLAVVLVVGIVLPCLAADEGAKLSPELAPYKGPSRNDVDATTLKGKVMCGYQGWFSTPGDGPANRYIHWSMNAEKVLANSVTVDYWPDMTDYPKSEWMPVAGLKHKDGRQAYLFSSARPATMDVHFKWMREYGIDGVYVQRFVCGLENPPSASGMLAQARNSANRHGRVFSITYDMSGTPTEKLYDWMVNDWKFLVDRMKITKDKRYLHHNGKPVLQLFGFYPERFPAETANKIIDFFKNDPKYGTFLVCSGAWWWRSINDADWAGWPAIYRRFNAITPWNPGNSTMSADNKFSMASTSYWADDLKECRKLGIMYMPVIYPGFTWDNLQRAYGNPQGAGHPLSRRGGDFLWEQFVTATEQKVDTIYIAMFDEVDEGTAIFKVTNDPPVGIYMATYEGKPSDWYLRLTGYGTKMFRGRVPLTKTTPANP
ncbi:MAG: glycoside hydrolase family 71/99-like protein [Armatimonadota bacterium]|nr:glycoside hydrolase family 71/99-like protein [Armatimonadota bacterium]